MLLGGRRCLGSLSQKVSSGSLGSIPWALGYHHDIFRESHSTSQSTSIVPNQVFVWRLEELWD